MIRYLLCFSFILITACSHKPVPSPQLPPISYEKIDQVLSYKGYDVLALAQYCDTYLKAPRLEAVSTLLSTFKDPLPCLKKALDRGGLKLVQVDLIDATCWRNKVCPAGAPKPDDLKVIEARARRVQVLANAYKDTLFQVSPALEHDVKDVNKVRAMLAAAKKGCPLCATVNSPFSGARPPNANLELHGTRIRAWSVSGDGASMFDADNKDSDNNGFNHTRSGTFSTYAWFNSLNLRCTGEKTFVPPANRTHRPTSDEFIQAARLFQVEESKPSAPALCRTSRDVDGKKGEIVKPNAEDYCNGNANENDARGNKPLLIIRKSGARGERAKIYNSRGKEIGCFKYYGTYTTAGTHRWYVGDCSGETPVQLMNELGSEWGFVQFKDKSCIRFNSIRREGITR